jgi:glutaconate CoA-transferase, subunit B
LHEAIALQFTRETPSRSKDSRIYLCMMKPDPGTMEFIVASLHPVTRDQIRTNTGWDVRFADHVEETRPPDAHELATLRDLNARTARAHGVAAAE